MEAETVAHVAQITRILRITLRTFAVIIALMLCALIAVKAGVI